MKKRRTVSYVQALVLPEIKIELDMWAAGYLGRFLK